MLFLSYPKSGRTWVRFLMDAYLADLHGIRVANVFEARIDTTDVLSMNFTPEEQEVYNLEKGDILLNEGQSAELVGRPALYEGDPPSVCFQNTLVRFRSGGAVKPEFALIVFRRFGSHTTMSASAPSTIAPFRGYMLRIFAMLVEVTATNSFIVSRPVLTPFVHSTGMRSSRPPVPFGIFVKSPAPVRFCSVVKEQWSVATTCSDPACRPAHSESWWSLLRNGGLMTRRAA